MVGPSEKSLAEEANQPRKATLTALCYDLVDSTTTLEALGIERYKELQIAFQNLAHQAIAANSGEIAADSGDGGLAIFPSDLDPRDAATLAIRAGLGIVSACQKFSAGSESNPLIVRVGIATSQTIVLPTTSHLRPIDVTGPALALATRLQSLAESDAVLVSHDTRMLVGKSFAFKDFGRHQVKGFSALQQVWQAMRPRSNITRYLAFAQVRKPAVDRMDEASLLLSQWNGLLKGSGGVAVLEGEAGIGKSRLVRHFLRLSRMRQRKLLFLQCAPNGMGSPLHPVRHALGPATLDVSELKLSFEHWLDVNGINDTEFAAPMMRLLGLEETGENSNSPSHREILMKIEERMPHVLAQLCAEGPMVVTIEDVQWIDPTSKALLTAALKHIGGFPIMVLVTARPGVDLSWLGSNVTHQELKPLPLEDARKVMLAESGKAVKLSEELVDLAVAVSGSNPLYLEEIGRWAAENSQILQSDLALGKSIQIPKGIQSVVEARLKSRGLAKRIAFAAAVVGSYVSLQLINLLLSDLEPKPIARALENLRESELIQDVGDADSRLFRFRHGLVRDAVYDSALESQQRAMHGRVYQIVSESRGIAPWIETSGLALHAEKAGYLEAAVKNYLTAGQENSRRSALPESKQLLQKAFELTKSIANKELQAELRLEILAALGPVVTSLDGPASSEAQRIYDEGVALARTRSKSEQARWYPLYWGWWFTDPQINSERAHIVQNELKHVDDAEVQLQTRHSVWAIDFYMGHHDACIAAVDTGLPLYDRSSTNLSQTMRYGGHDTKVCGLVHRGLSYWFRGQVQYAIIDMRNARAIAKEGGHAGSLAHALRNSAIFNTIRRDVGALSSDIVDLQDLARSKSFAPLAAMAEVLSGWCMVLKGEAKTGLEVMQTHLARHKSVQTLEDHPIFCGLLAEAEMIVGDEVSALAAINEGISTAQETGYMYWLSQLLRYKACLLLRAARADEAQKAIWEAAALAKEQGALPILRSLRACAEKVGRGEEYDSVYSQTIKALELGAEKAFAPYVVAEPDWMLSS